MAEQDVAHAAQETSANQPTGDFKMLVLAALVLTLVAAPTGWVLGRYFTGDDATLTQNAPLKKGMNLPENITANSRVIALSPITTDMSSEEGGRIRIEVALVGADIKTLQLDLVAEIANDFVALLRQTRISQIKGASGFMYLREDLLERAKIRSNGKISNILISTMVIEQS